MTQENRVNNGELKVSMGQIPTGTIVAFILSTKNIPKDWLLCDGSNIPDQYGNFKTLLGSDTVPNLAGRTLIGTGKPASGNVNQDDGRTPNFNENQTIEVCQTGGEAMHQLTENEMPSHNHLISNCKPADYCSHQYSDHDDRPYIGGSEHWFNDLPVSNTGSDDSHNTMQPYLSVHYIIYTGGS